ncbi:hypothetical protein WJX74_005964 [Apatococcus lobatus]|uniref:Uncharacterized protein n=1 Tax=Apatococcus lobatus TaxID=904363 RepID=A0AAW1RC22_9CHLO
MLLSVSPDLHTGLPEMLLVTVTHWCSKLADHPYIFMRWKEQAFVDAKEDCGLTITGFYYICLSRLDGSIQGLYCDPKSTPYQLLELQPANSHQGHTVGRYQFC